MSLTHQLSSYVDQYRAKMHQLSRDMGISMTNMINAATPGYKQRSLDKDTNEIEKSTDLTAPNGNNVSLSQSTLDYAHAMMELKMCTSKFSLDMNMLNKTVEEFKQ